MGESTTAKSEILVKKLEALLRTADAGASAVKLVVLPNSTWPTSTVRFG